MKIIIDIDTDGQHCVNCEHYSYLAGCRRDWHDCNLWDELETDENGLPLRCDECLAAGREYEERIPCPQCKFWRAEKKCDTKPTKPIPKKTRDEPTCGNRWRGGAKDFCRHPWRCVRKGKLEG